jgi:glycosyltransferase involved in cell wall biosynthesis
MEKPPISVIIVAKNAESTIEECLDSVRRNNPAEIIVVDGNSSDKTVEIARKYTDRIYSDEGKGLSYARQLGAEQATLEYIAYVDSDVVLTEGALATMFAEVQGSECVSVRAREGTDGKFASYWELAQYQHNQLRNVENRLGTLASLFRKEIILKYGFDLSERPLDDVDLEIRLARDGYKFGTSSALYYNRYRADLKSLVKYRFFLGGVAVRYIRKYGPWHAGFWPPVATLYWLAICLIKGKPKLIPYFVVDGFAKTGGMVKGFFELIGETLRRGQE